MRKESKDQRAYGYGKVRVPAPLSVWFSDLSIRDYNALALAIASGARNLAENELFPVPPLTLARCTLPHLRAQTDELSHLECWLTEGFMRTIWIAAMNEVMAVARKSLAKSTAKYQHAVTVPEAWRHLAIYLAKHARVTNPDYALAVEVLDEAKSVLGKCRRKAMNAACDFAQDKVKHMYEYFNLQALSHVHSGSVVTIDETVLAYYGRDGKVNGIWRRIPEKPHSKGLLQYRTVTYLRYSLRRFVLSILPLLADQ